VNSKFNNNLRNDKSSNDINNRVLGWKDLQNDASEGKSSIEDGEISGCNFETEIIDKNVSCN